MSDVTAARIDLVAITAAELLALAEVPQQDDMFAAHGVTNPHGVLTRERIPHAARIADVRANPDHIAWYYRLIVERQTRQVAGSISFHAPPDANGMIEVGLGIAEPCRGRGLATEALRAMWTWACDQPGVTTLRYTVSPDNAPSQAIIAKFPARHVGVQIDDEDGPEDIYEMTVAEYLAGSAAD